MAAAAAGAGASASANHTSVMAQQFPAPGNAVHRPKCQAAHKGDGPAPDSQVMCLACEKYLCRKCDAAAHANAPAKAHYRFPVATLVTYVAFEGPAVAGESRPRRALTAVAGPRYVAKPQTVYDAMRNSAKQFANRPFLGTRTVTADGRLGPYAYATYGEVYARVLHFAAGLRAFGIEARDRVGLYSANRAEWIIAEQAAHCHSMLTVPLYDTLGADAAEQVMSQSGCSVVVCAQDKLKGVLSVAAKLPALKLVVVMPCNPWDDQKKAIDLAAVSAANATALPHLSLQSFAAVEAKGRAGPQAPHVPPHPDDLYTLCYTSGTTGTPKGAMLSHANIMSDVEAVSLAGINFLPEDVTVSYLPLAHMFERMIITNGLAHGASTAFSRGNPLLLLEDIEAVRPTVFVGVPRLYNRLYDKILQTVGTSGAVKKWLFDTAYASKKAGLQNNKKLTHWLWDRLVFAKIAARLGGRVRLLATGSAPISGPVLQFLRICFSAQVVEGYGQTEGTCATSLTPLADVNAAGNVGVPLPCNEVKLVDVPEMNYTARDVVNGVPAPRGEIWVRGSNVFQGYYKDEVNTKETIADGGWLRTGDVGMWLPDGSLKIIDRKKNIFKLSQGEYIAPEKIENVYVSNKFIAQIFVYGDSLQSELVAVVVPDEEALTAWAKTNKALANAKDFKALCAEPAVQQLLLQEMDATGKARELRGFEFVKRIFVSSELFTADNGLLTPTFKLKRNEAKKKYADQIAAMYAAIDAQHKQAVANGTLKSKL